MRRPSERAAIPSGQGAVAVSFGEAEVAADRNPSTIISIESTSIEA